MHTGKRSGSLSRFPTVLLAMEKIRVLDCFSGTGSIRKCADDSPDKFSCVSLDISDALHPVEILCDIMDWKYKCFPPDSFDIIFASPPCTQYSIARTTGKLPRDIDGANKVVQRVLEIIRYFNPAVALIENPGSGYLKQQPFMQNLNYFDVAYCRYADWGYRKWTRFWHMGRKGIPNFQPLFCKHNDRCKEWCTVAKRHPRTFSSRRGIQGEIISVPVHERYRIPPMLVKALLDEAEKEVINYRDEMAMLSAADTAFD